MMVARAIVAVPATLVGDPGIASADIALILPALQEIGNRKGGVAVPIFSDSSPRNSVYRHSFELIDGDRFNICSLDVGPSDIEGRCHEGSDE